MPIIRTTQANMLGGISQQDPKVRSPSSFEDARNVICDPVTGLRRRGPIELIREPNRLLTPGSTFEFHSYKRDAEEEYHFEFEDDGASNGTITAFDAVTGDDIQVHVAGSGDPGIPGIDSDYSTRSYSTSIADYLALGTRASEDKIRATTIQDTTFVWNRDVTTAVDATVVAPTDAPYAYIAVIAGNYSTQYAVDLEDPILNRTPISIGTYNGTYTGFAGSGSVPTGLLTGLNTIRTDQIAAELCLKIQALGGSWATDTWCCGSVVAIKISTTGLTGIFANDSVGDSNLRVFYKDTPRVEGWLPTIAVDYTTMRVSGAAEIDADDYYVQFRNESLHDFVHPLAAIGSTGLRLGKGRWQEHIEPATEIAIDPTTMPIKITRMFDDGSATVTGPGGGSAYDPYFLVDYVRWNDKTAGLITDEHPSFIGETIEDIFFYKERLGILSSNKVNLSETGDYFNFYRKTNLVLRDTAPIDITVPYNQPVYFTHGLPSSEDVTLFSHLGQFILRGSDILSPRTVEVLPASDFPSLPGVKPLSAGRRIFVPFERNGFSGIRELFKAPEATRYQDADITLNVPELLPGKITAMWAAENENVLMVRTDGADDVLYVYKWLFSGQDKVISAWTIFDIPGDVKTGLFSGSTFKFLGRRPFFSSDYIGVHQLSLNGTDSDIFLDFQHDQDQVTSKVYSAPYTTITTLVPGLQAEIDNGRYKFVAYDGEGQPKEMILESSDFTDGQFLTVKVEGDYSSAPIPNLNFMVGLSYDSTVTYTPPYVLETAGNAGIPHISDVQKVMRGYVAYSDAVNLNVNVTVGSRTQIVYPLDLSIPTTQYDFWEGTEGQGDHRFSVRGKPAEGTIVLSCDNIWDMHLQGTQWEIQYRSKKPRLQA